MRVNLSLNKNNSKDERIIKFLESKYNASAYIKEVLYQLSYGGIQEFGVSIGNRTDMLYLWLMKMAIKFLMK